jgi:putative serine protease PepD
MAAPSGAEHAGRRAARWALAVLAVLAAGVVGGVIANAINGTSNATISTISGAGGSCDVAAVADQKLPSVVTISAGGGASGGVGSGEIIRPDGYILTNNHVIAPAVSGGSLEVLFSDGKTARATITGRDPLTDLAVIRVSGESGLPTIAIGNSANLRIGQPVIALGAPLGLSSTVTAGIVSALDRTVSVPGEGSQSALLIDAIQTDAAINPGNSGGALVDCSAKLVGVPTAGATASSPSGESSVGNIGLGFAIPVNLATTVADELIATGRVTHAFLGVQAQPVSANASSQSGVAEGLSVTGVVAGGPAASAGLRMGDVITSIDGQPAVSTDQLVEVTLRRRAGEQVALGYQRGGSQATATVTLGSRP